MDMEIIVCGLSEEAKKDLPFLGALAEMMQLAHDALSYEMLLNRALKVIALEALESSAQPAPERG